MPPPRPATSHLLVPHASALAEGCAQALQTLALPALSQVLAVMTPGDRDEGDPYTYSPPHERALALALGWAGAPGCLPWAAHLAAADGQDPTDLAWGLLTPAQWHVGVDQVSMSDPDDLKLDEAGSRALFEAVRPLFESEGWLLVWGAPLRWYAAHESLANLPTAALDRVIGRPVDAWMPDHPQARLIRRLQNEVQMLLYQHPVNDDREAAGLPPVNTFWLSGCGARQPVRDADMPTIDARLRAPVLRQDWAAWAEAWRALDRERIAPLLDQVQAGQPCRLTLCGERSAQSWTTAPGGWLTRLTRRWRRTSPVDALGGL